MSFAIIGNELLGHAKKLNWLLLGLVMLIPGLLKLFVMKPNAIVEMLTGLGIPGPAFFAWVLIIGEIVAGVEPKTDSEGCLQDVYWSGGNIAYFPTYAIGNIYTAMIWKKLDSVVDMNKISKEDFSDIREWLKENIHKYDRTMLAKDIIKRAVGKDMDVNDYLDYLKARFYDMYGVE